MPENADLQTTAPSGIDQLKELAKQAVEPIEPINGLQQSTARPPRFTQEQINGAIITEKTQLPQLAQAVAVPMPLSINYWSPENPGESIMGWVAGIDFTEVADMETGELKMLESVFFMRQHEDGKIERIFNSGRKLVGNVKSAILRGDIVPGGTLTPVLITYKGLKKNSRNAYKSKDFEILPLIVNAPQSQGE